MVDKDLVEEDKGHLLVEEDKEPVGVGQGMVVGGDSHLGLGGDSRLGVGGGRGRQWQGEGKGIRECSLLEGGEGRILFGRLCRRRLFLHIQQGRSCWVVVGGKRRGRGGGKRRGGWKISGKRRKKEGRSIRYMHILSYKMGVVLFRLVIAITIYICFSFSVRIRQTPRMFFDVVRNNFQIFVW